MTFRQLLASTSLLIVAVICALPVVSAAGQETGMRVTVELQEYDDSGVSGTAILTETTSGIHVSMTLDGAELDGNHPTHIHTGTCDNFDPSPLYPLETVNLNPVNDEGMSETDVDDVVLTELYDGEYVILVHQSPENLTDYLVCGEIGSGTISTTAPETAGNTPAAGDMPATGVGSTVANETSGYILVAVLACFFAMAALVVRRSAR